MPIRHESQICQTNSESRFVLASGATTNSTDVTLRRQYERPDPHEEYMKCQVLTKFWRKLFDPACSIAFCIARVLKPQHMSIGFFLYNVYYLNSARNRWQPRSQGSLLPALQSVGQVGENPGNEFEPLDVISQPGGYSTKFYTRMVCPEEQSLTLLYTTLDHFRRGTSLNSYTYHWQMVTFSK